MPLCRVPFQQALSLISNRSVYLQKGFAYVPLQKLVSIIVTNVSKSDVEREGDSESESDSESDSEGMSERVRERERERGRVR